MLANEWICANLGWHIRLPIPPFALMRKGGSPRYFASMDFGSQETTPPDMKPGKVVDRLPLEATGVIVFDIFIANPDRHEENLKVDNADVPTAMEVFDHDYALLGHSKKNNGINRLKHVDGNLGLGKGVAGKNFHKLAPLLKTDTHFHIWIDRIARIPDSFIEDVGPVIFSVSPSQGNISCW